MKVVGLIPYLMGYRNGEVDESSRDPIKLGGRYLINYSIGLLNGISEVDEVVVYASEPTILQYVESDLYYSFVKRPELLDEPNASIEDIIRTFLSNSDADIVVLLHPNSPFLKPSTIEECIGKVASGDYDSAFTAYEFRKFAWHQGEPLNYSLSEPTPHLRTIEPVVLEQSSLYVFSRRIFEAESSRVGGQLFVRPINQFEGHEVEDPEDLEVAELIVNSGMYSSR